MKDKGVRISMDGKGRALDNVFIERLWRSFKYECLFSIALQVLPNLPKATEEYFTFYNHDVCTKALVTNALTKYIMLEANARVLGLYPNPEVFVKP